MIHLTRAIPERIRGGLRRCAIQIDVYFTLPQTVIYTGVAVVDFPDEVAAQPLADLPSSFYDASSVTASESDSGTDESNDVDSDSGYGIARRRPSCCCAARCYLDDLASARRLVLVARQGVPSSCVSRSDCSTFSFDVDGTECGSAAATSVLHDTVTVNVGVNTTVSSCQLTHPVVRSRRSIHVLQSLPRAVQIGYRT